VTDGIGTDLVEIERLSAIMSSRNIWTAAALSNG
jgi:phosphopantetheinyl transferase (holo-ACP synthase)